VADPQLVAVVTGAGSGIGEAIANRLLGDRLAVVANDLVADALTGLSRREDVAIVPGDITDPSVIKAMIETAVERFGRLDVLVNNAGAADRSAGADECTDEEWASGIALHLTAPFAASREAIPHMRRVGGGLIVNISSAAGFSGALSGVTYTAAKHALIGLSRNIATMYVEDGVRCVVVCPGLTHTGSAKARQSLIDAGRISERAKRTRTRVHAAFPRRAEADEIGRLVAHLVRGDGLVLNGAILTADSGYAAHR
jgi:NAD(P)-dependent dehydrogenase (short-subunit alcohol dehydrogenase family)